MLGFGYGGVISINQKKQTFDERWMYEALKEATLCQGHPNPNPSVGCVIVKEGRCIGRGHTQSYKFEHAERKAFESVQNSKELIGATVYITLEPCSKQGYQPPCLDLLKPISRVVIGCEDPNPEISSIEILKNMGKEVVVGVLRSECEMMISAFAHQMNRGEVFLGVKWAQSLDGMMADDWGQSKWISSEASRDYVHLLRQRYDAIAVGGGTVLQDVPSLTVRSDAIIKKRQPIKFIFDPNGKVFQITDQQLNVLKDKTFASEVNVFIYTKRKYCRSGPLASWIKTVKHIQIIPLEDRKDPFNEFVESFKLGWISEKLGRPFQSVLIEGGPRLIQGLVERGLVHFAHVFISPKWMGGEKYKIGLREPHRLEKAFLWRQQFYLPLGEDILMEFKI